MTMSELLSLTALVVMAAACAAPVPPPPRTAVDVVAVLSDSDPLLAASVQQACERACERAPADAASQRRAVAGTLVRLLEQREPFLAGEQRTAVVRVLMREADEYTLRSLAPFLEDPDLGAVTLEGFIRAKDPATDRILIDRLRASWRPPDTVFAAIGARRASSAVETLLGFAEGGEPAAAARRALAQIGDARAEAVLRAARDDELEGADEDWRLYCQRRSNP